MSNRVDNPKVYNPYSYHRPHFIRWRGSVIPKVLPSTIVGHFTRKPNTAYDRYWEGRRLWARQKHYLREEDGLLHDDLKPLFQILNRIYQDKNNKVDVPTTNSMYGALKYVDLDCLTQFERILRIESLKYITIPIVFLASFILIGILHIGGEIENPFGYDENDLDLDDFCGTIKRELDIITSRKRTDHEVRNLLYKENERNSIETNIIREVIQEERDEKDEKDGNSNVTIKVD
ncbi:unnamed protein product [Rhizophagus irregularis]|nr:unnamed protein product [Rhizophagus irregularis]